MTADSEFSESSSVATTDVTPSMSSILETVLYYKNEERTEEYYTHVLKMKLINKTPGRNLFYRAGSSVFLLFNAEKTLEPGFLPPHGATGQGHVCFRVPEMQYDHWKEYLQKKGVIILKEVEWGQESNAFFRKGRSFYFRDPSENLLEIANGDMWPE